MRESESLSLCSTPYYDDSTTVNTDTSAVSATTHRRQQHEQRHSGGFPLTGIDVISEVDSDQFEKG